MRRSNGPQCADRVPLALEAFHAMAGLMAGPAPIRGLPLLGAMMEVQVDFTSWQQYLDNLGQTVRPSTAHLTKVRRCYHRCAKCMLCLYYSRSPTYFEVSTSYYALGRLPPEQATTQKYQAVTVS